MTNTLTISRDQLERWTTGRVSLSHLEEMRAILAAPAVERQAEPVTMDGKTTIRQYVAESVPEDQILDDWTKGYEECKRRIHQMLMQPINAAPPAPVTVVLDEGVEFEKWWCRTPVLRKSKLQMAQEAWEARACLSTKEPHQ